MAADLNKPVPRETLDNLCAVIRDNFAALVTAMEFGDPANLPAGAKKLLASGVDRWDGDTWQAFARFADLGGNATQRFKVAAAVDADEAVNRAFGDGRYLMRPSGLVTVNGTSADTAIANNETRTVASTSVFSVVAGQIVDVFGSVNLSAPSGGRVRLSLSKASGTATITPVTGGAADRHLSSATNLAIQEQRRMLVTGGGTLSVSFSVQNLSGASITEMGSTVAHSTVTAMVL